MKKILFLDIDGVLNTQRWHKKMVEGHAPKDSFGYDFDPEAVANLCRIIEATGAEIVISSSWKGYGMDGLQELWETRDLPGKVIDPSRCLILCRPTMRWVSAKRMLIG